MTNFHIKRLPALLCTAVLVLAAALPVSAATTTPPRPAALRVDASQVEVMHVIDRDLHIDYTVTGSGDRTAVINALNTLTYDPTTSVTPDMKKLWLLQIRFKDGQKYEYWCHTNTLMLGNDQVANGASCTELRKALATCRNNYPANIEWLGYMNPYRVTDLQIYGNEKPISYQSALSATQRDAILNICAKLKAVKVNRVQQLNDTTMRKPLASTELEKWLYTLTLKFETDVETYRIYLFDSGRVTLSVGSINYNLTYRSADQVLYQALLDALK